MFIYSLKSNSIKLGVTIVVSFSVLLLLLWFLPSDQTSQALDTSAQTEINYCDISTESARRNFIEKLGWQVVEGSGESHEVTIPSDFDKIFVQYNELQKRQGLDLSKYKRKTITKYTYEIENFEKWQGRVYINILIYNGNVIGGDICSEEVNGFVCGFDGQY